MKLCGLVWGGGVRAQTSEEGIHVEQAALNEESKQGGKCRVEDGILVHTGELMKHINILMKKEASILTVREL